MRLYIFNLGWIAFKTNKTLVERNKKSALCDIKGLFLGKCNNHINNKMETRKRKQSVLWRSVENAARARRNCCLREVLGGSWVFHCDLCWQLLGCAEKWWRPSKPNKFVAFSGFLVFTPLAMHLSFPKIDVSSNSSHFW